MQAELIASSDNIRNLIYTVRGKQVMLDSDVAMLYHYETKNINKAIKRNIERFPEEFYFQLTESELEFLRFQFGTSKDDNKKINEMRGGRRYLPYVFTEQGIAMLSGVLRNEIAIKVSINIIKTAKEKILIIDNYTDDSILDILSKKNKKVEVIILTSKNSTITKLDIEKFNKQYPILKVEKTNIFHDRFIIIDGRKLYHCGASIKDLGKKCFGINKIEDSIWIDKLYKTCQ